MQNGEDHEPEGRAPAPDRLRVVQELLNTNDVEAGSDELADPAAAARWFADHGLLDADTRLTRRNVAQVIELREALRTLVLANNGEPIEHDSLAAINRVASECPLTVHIGPDGAPTLVPGGTGLQPALAALLATVQAAAADGTWARLKACRNHTCRWAFYDSSRNRSGAWCVMSVCGNRAKVRAFRERHTADA
ncbi:MAG: CGNR zinc finger domain-containing protein [Acidimicrobiales bacterium]